MDIPATRRNGMTISELLEVDHLELELLAGASGAGRSVTWTHASELPHPELWLDGGELLIINGLGLPAEAAGQIEFVSGLIEKRAAGLAIGVLGPDLDRRTLEVADEHDFPIVHVPKAVPFLSIARLVAAHSQDDAQRRMATHIRLFDALRAGCEPAKANELFAKLEEISNYRLFLTTTAGTPLLPGLPEIPASIGDHLDRTQDELERQSYSVPGGHAAPIPLGDRTAGYLVAVERDGLAPAGVGAVRHLATIAALLISNVYRERELERRRGAELLGRVLTSSDAEQVGEMLTGTGLEIGPLRMCKLRASRETVDEIHHRLCDMGVLHLLTSDDSEAYLVTDDVSESLHVVLYDTDAITGMSDRYPPQSSWGLPRLQATRALDRALAEQRPSGTIAEYSPADSPLEWLPADPVALKAFSEAILRPLQDYDREHSSALVESLATYFECDRRLSVAADRLFVHKHTLAYRLKRIEQISRRNLARMDDLCAVWMALKAAELVGSDSPAPGG
jgi:PucR family transcriptional regulator, purine catabolism regulatory protein